MDDAFEAAKALFLEGAALLDGGRAADAERCFVQSLARVPGRPSTLVNLALARLALQRPADALAALDEALAADPAAPDAQCHRAGALATLGRVDEAAAQLHALLDAHPRFGAAWAMLGQLERDRGRLPEARHALQRAVAHGADGDAVRFALAALGDGEAPAAAPPAYVRALFDSYAGDFEGHLLHTLHYRAHDAVVQAAAPGAPYALAIDLGCGTGLCGDGLRALARRLVGVDLSATMVQRARERGRYDDVQQAEALQFLHATPLRPGLVTAADVLIYIGDPSPLLAAVRRVLAPGGRFVFSVEEGEAAVPYVLRPSLRYAHGELALRDLATREGFRVAQVDRLVLREEQRQPIAGLVFTLAA